MRYLLILLFVFGFIGVKQSQAVECLPSCDRDDSRFLEIAGTGLSTIAGAEIIVNLVSNGDNLEFSIFDGEAAGLWDVFGGPAIEIHLQFQLFADPTGDSSGLGGIPLAIWTSDGSFGINAGQPMPDNDWVDFSFPNTNSALSIPPALGDFTYTLHVTPIDPMLGGMTSNVFKVRTAEIMYVPAMTPVTFISNISGDTAETQIEALNIVYPDADADLLTNSFCGMPPGVICDLNDPSCCLFETTYDGTWRFFMEVPAGETELFVWDGDFDYGDLAGTVFDTNDPNTPGDPFLPSWSIGTDVVFQTARPAVPHDNNGDSSIFFAVRDPNIQYFLISPEGDSYQNFNPSGDREWELFKLSTLTNDPAVAEYMVDNIPGGLWEVRIIGLDISNLNSILLPFDLRGEIIDPPEPVPTLNQWGLIALAVMGLFVSIFYLRRKRGTEING